MEKLEENLRVFDSNLKKRENEELRKKRLAYVGISLDNVLPNKDRENKENAGIFKHPPYQPYSTWCSARNIPTHWLIKLK